MARTGGATRIIFGTAAPTEAPPKAGYLYIDTTNDNLYFATDDQLATDWILTAGGGGSVAWGAISGVLANQTDLQAALDAKAAASHTHAIADVTNLQTTLDGKAPTSHTHAQSDITGLVAALAGKSDVGHGHVAADITDFAEAVDDRVDALLQAGANITLTYDDINNTYTIAASVTGGSGTPMKMEAPANRLTPFFHADMDTDFVDFWGNGTTSLITTGQIEGIGAMNIVTNGASGLCGMRWNITDADWSGKSFRVFVKASAWANLTSADILISTSGVYTSYYILNLKNAVVAPVDGEWIEVTWTLADMTASGTPDITTANDIAFRATDNGTAVTVNFDGFSVIPIERNKGIVSITFDDCRATQYTFAKEYLETNGIYGTFYIIPSLVGTAGYMTQAQIDELHRNGHEIAIHGGTNLTTLTGAPLQSELDTLKQYQLDHGYSDNFSYPNGAINDEVRVEVAKRFSSARNIIWQGNNPDFLDQYGINAYSPTNATATATLTGAGDDAETQKTWTVINFHNIPATATLSTDYSEANFQTVIDYIVALNVDVKTVQNVLTASGGGGVTLPLSISDITDLQNQLDGKANVGAAGALVHVYPTADLTGSGDYINNLVATQDIAIASQSIRKTAGGWELTNASNQAGAEGIVAWTPDIRTTALSNLGTPLRAYLGGQYIKDNNFNFADGVPVYINTVDGSWTTTAPTGTGTVVRQIGEGTLDPTVIWFDPNAYGWWVNQ